MSRLRPTTALNFAHVVQAISDWFVDSPDCAGGQGDRACNGLLQFAQRSGMQSALAEVLFDPGYYCATHDGPALNLRSDAEALRHYVAVGCRQHANPNSWFDEAFYRTAYPDVRSEIDSGAWVCAYQHYLVRGCIEHRNPNADFNELGYLGSNADVLEAVREGTVPSGVIHFMTMGHLEKRQTRRVSPPPLLRLPLTPENAPVSASASFAEQLYLTANGDVGVDGAPMPGMRHWLANGLREDRAGRRARVRRYVETLYLRDNPDIGAAVQSGNQPSGYHHFLNYGWAEGRPWAGEQWDAAERKLLKQALETRSAVPAGLALPTVSVIVPVYNTPAKALRECIQSVLGQTYPDWELWLADDGSHRPQTLEVLAEAARGDARVRVDYAAVNAGISSASNAALARCGSEVVALLDHDDLLAPDALLRVAEAFRSKPDVDLVYTDEAKLNEAGDPIDLNPKPGWSPELLLSTMYIGHLTAYRRSVLEALGGFRPGFDGTQDYDLALRAAEIVRSVVHVPLPLYFWRLSSTSTAGSLAAKPGVLDLQREALETTLIRRREHGTVRPGHAPGHWDVALDPPDGSPLVSVVIPTAGRRTEIGGQEVDLVANCLRSLALLETYPNYEFVVVHNNDLEPETLLELAGIDRLRLVAYVSDRFNLSEKINLGVEHAAGEFVLLLNDDMQAASPHIIRSMIGRMFKGVGLVGGRLLYADGTLQHAGVVWTSSGPTHAMIGEHRLTAGPGERLRVVHDCFGVSGACMFFRRDLFRDLGGFSSALPTNYNDVDFCLKVRERGLRIVFDPAVELYHFESLSKSGTNFWELQLLCLQHPGLADPYRNPAFSDASPFYELRDPAASAAPSYTSWLLQSIGRRRERLTRSTATRFSIILSVYNVKRYQLEELEASIGHQTYANWEWVVVDNGSTLPETLSWLQQIRGKPGVSFVHLPKNQGIMGGYGTAFRSARGDYVVPVDGDDFLTLDALQVLATAIEAHAFPDVVYSDEDKATDKGSIHSPFLKPDWDPVLFTNICYVCHVCAIKRESAQAVEAYTDPKATWCHDWDTLWRMDRARARIVHVPEVLYSWRIHPGSTASIETSGKPAALVSQKHVLDQHLRLTGLADRFDIVQNDTFGHAGIWRLKPKAGLPPTALILIVTDEVGRLSSLLADIGRDLRPEDALIVVGESAAFRRAVDRLPPEFLELLGPANAQALRERHTLAEALARCEREGRPALAVLDAGASRLSRSWLPESLGLFAVQPDVAAVAGQVILPDGNVAWRGGFFGFGGLSASPDHGKSASDSGYHGMSWCQRSCDSVPATFFCATTDVLKAIAGRVDEAGLTLRTLAGHVVAEIWQRELRVVYTPFVQVTLGQTLSVEPIMPQTATLPGSRPAAYYHPAFGRTVDTAYCLAPVPARAT